MSLVVKSEYLDNSQFCEAWDKAAALNNNLAEKMEAAGLDIQELNDLVQAKVDLAKAEIIALLTSIIEHNDKELQAKM